MIPASFTFLNTTGAPDLSPSAAKAMRAHVTRTNFAHRRQRMAEARNAETAPDRVAGSQMSQELSSRNASPKARLAVNLPPVHPHHSAQLLSSFWSHVFLDSSDYPDNPDEATWLRLLVSEPALIESSVAVSMQHWASDASWIRNAEIHSKRAVNILIQRIESRRAHTDAVLAVVLTMALGERLVHNNIAWNIHMDGLGQLLRERFSRGMNDLPSWFTGLLISDSINNLFNFPRVYHKTVIDAITLHGNQSLSFVAEISDGTAQLWRSIDFIRTYQLGLSFVVEAIEQPLARLHSQARALRRHSSPCIQANALAIKLILCLSWPTQSEPSLETLATELKEVLCMNRARTCSYLDFTSFQLMIGAIAAETGSQTRAWFLGKLRRAMLALQSRGWDEPLEVFDKVCVPDIGLTGRFRTLWNELKYANSDGKENNIASLYWIRNSAGSTG